MLHYKSKVIRRRERRQKQREAIRNIILNHLISEDSDDNISTYSTTFNNNMSSSRPPSPEPSFTAQDYYDNDSPVRNPYMLDEGDLWTDDPPKSMNDESLPLYKNARISVNSAITSLINFVTEHYLDKSAVTRLFKLIKSLLPTPNILPTTHKKILKSFGKVSLYNSKFYCNGCDQLCKTQGNKKVCDNRLCVFSDAPLKSSDVSEIVILDIASQLKSIIDRNFSLLINCQHLFPSSDIKFGEQYRLMRQSNQLRITFNIHSDGAPLVRTTKSSLWPLFASIVELPPQVREFQSNILVFGLWASNKKPNVDLFMRDSINQLLDLENDGLKVIIGGREISIDIQRQMFIADLPAKALFLKTIHFNGYFACTVCTSSGKHD